MVLGQELLAPESDSYCPITLGASFMQLELYADKNMTSKSGLSSLEMCAGAGGQALGLELAGFAHEALVECDSHCCNTLRTNRPTWDVFEQDLNEFDGRPFKGVELLAGGLPCPPFSKAGKQLGENDERRELYT